MFVYLAFLQQPTSVNATLNSNVSFTCSSNNDSIAQLYWQFNNGPLCAADDTECSDTTFFSNTTITISVYNAVATVANNNTEIICKLFIVGQFISSNKATLLAQGTSLLSYHV